MIPSRFVVKSELPRTANGKIDKKKLLSETETRYRLAIASPRNRRPSVSEFRAPEGDMEIRIAAVWTKILHIDFVPRLGHFFELGGTSLSVMLVQQALLHELGQAIPIEVFYAKPTLRELAAAISEIQQQGTSDLTDVKFVGNGLDLQREATLPPDIAQSIDDCVSGTGGRDLSSLSV